MTIGIGVEGPSDRVFWNKVLHASCRKINFDVWNMKNRPKLIRETPRLVDTFRNAHYAATFIILDRDESPCISSVLDEFEQNIRDEARKPLQDRSVFICVAIRELEAWYLADDAAIKKILPRSKYNSPSETGTLNAEKVLKVLWRQHYDTALNKIDFAKQIAKIFDPQKAQRHSSSFEYFWDKICSKTSAI